MPWHIPQLPLQILQGTTFGYGHEKATRLLSLTWHNLCQKVDNAAMVLFFEEPDLTAHGSQLSSAILAVGLCILQRIRLASQTLLHTRLA